MLKSFVNIDHIDFSLSDVELFNIWIGNCQVVLFANALIRQSLEWLITLVLAGIDEETVYRVISSNTPIGKCFPRTHCGPYTQMLACLWHTAAMSHLQPSLLFLVCTQSHMAYLTDWPGLWSISHAIRPSHLMAPCPSSHCFIVHQQARSRSFSSGMHVNIDQLRGIRGTIDHLP